MIQLGGFGFIKDYDEIKRAGFDYAELDMPEIEALKGDGIRHPPRSPHSAHHGADILCSGFPGIQPRSLCPLLLREMRESGHQKHSFRQRKGPLADR